MSSSEASDSCASFASSTSSIASSSSKLGTPLNRLSRRSISFISSAIGVPPLFFSLRFRLLFRSLRLRFYFFHSFRIFQRFVFLRRRLVYFDNRSARLSVNTIFRL